jgi:hypothetical protein
MRKKGALVQLPLPPAVWRRLEVAGGVDWPEASQQGLESALQGLRDSQDIHANDPKIANMRATLVGLEADLDKARISLEGALNQSAVFRHLRSSSYPEETALEAIKNWERLGDSIARFQAITSKAQAALKGKGGRPSDMVVDGFLYVSRGYYGEIKGTKPYSENGWTFLAAAYSVATGIEIDREALEQRLKRSMTRVRKSKTKI